MSKTPDARIPDAETLAAARAALVRADPALAQAHERTPVFEWRLRPGGAVAPGRGRNEPVRGADRPQVPTVVALGEVLAKGHPAGRMDIISRIRIHGQVAADSLPPPLSQR